MKSKRGFALLSPEMRSAVAQLGGISAHRKGVAHEFTIKEASKAGKIGGKKKAQNHKLTLNEEVGVEAIV